ncbi:hypothetical protein BS50DRAFT_576902 [Corynespora cassiicola Philippines]|uniref:Uncharacterized protein n=1 Tax=Corynespora cassiicola Philippines TaxID=1448308 RepID=A0A2T2NCD0_CORCC|nr:hypothetical protein BS50DRAFT_576902 [Corynespora cassiicola Philippines]
MHPFLVPRLPVLPSVTALLRRRPPIAIDTYCDLLPTVPLAPQPARGPGLPWPRRPPPFAARALGCSAVKTLKRVKVEIRSAARLPLQAMLPLKASSPWLPSMIVARCAVGTSREAEHCRRSRVAVLVMLRTTRGPPPTIITRRRAPSSTPLDSMPARSTVPSRPSPD